MTERIRNTGDVLILYDDQHTLLRVTEPTRLLGAAYDGLHVLAGGSLIVAGIIRQRLVIDTGGACHASGYIRTVPKVAEGGFLDVTGHLDPVGCPPGDVDSTVLIAVGARYGEHVVTADGGLAAYGSTAPERINDSTPRFRITRSGPSPTLDGPIELSP